LETAAKGRSSAAKAAESLELYGTAEAVPFVQRFFPQPVKPESGFNQIRPD
jgi:hypothetical protein